MWRIIIEVILLTGFGFGLGLFTYFGIHKCPEPSSYSSYELRVYVPINPKETKKLMLHNRAQFSILQQLEEWEKQKERESMGIKRGK